MNINPLKNDLSGLRVTVMGLGVHGGGLAAAQYAVRRGAKVTVTDLRDEGALASSLDHLPDGCRVVLGRHEREDFSTADLVIKNPAVPRRAPLLAEAPAVTSDIALFLAEWTTLNAGVSASTGSVGTAPLVGITGTKGKSTCTSLTAHLLAGTFPGTRLGGNITISPLAFLDDLAPGDPVVLELSSFQLGDLAFFRRHNRREGSRIPQGLPEAVFLPVLPALVGVITNILRDHQDYYRSMDDYVEDKREVYRNVPSDGAVILPADDPWTSSFLADLDGAGFRGRKYLVGADGNDDAGDDDGGDDDGGDARRAAVPRPETLPLPGRHNRLNIRMAMLAARHVGVPEETVLQRLATFPGVPHRMQTVARRRGIRYVNDTAATIPEAAREAVTAYAEDPGTGLVCLIAGGSDKGLDMAPLLEAFRVVGTTGGAVALLAGTATDRLMPYLDGEDLPLIRTFGSLREAVDFLTE
ncbi:MAG: UDP-N-acetylmuramoyl-L-alanine--D-glutamate ligase, partial [Alkalispirochaeta sp.]